MRRTGGRGVAMLPAEGRGFTLLETTLAMAISAVLVGVLVVAIYQFTHLTRIYRNSLSVGAHLQTAATALNADVISAASGQVLVDGDTQSLALSVLHVSSESFGQPDLPASQQITYTYTTSGDEAGMLIRHSDAGGRMVSNYVSALSFGPSRTITSAVWVDIAVTIGDQQQETSFFFERRPSGE